MLKHDNNYFFSCFHPFRHMSGNCVTLRYKSYYRQWYSCVLLASGLFVVLMVYYYYLPLSIPRLLIENLHILGNNDWSWKTTMVVLHYPVCIILSHNKHRSNRWSQWPSQNRCKGGECPPWQRKNCQKTGKIGGNREKEKENREQIEKKRKNREEKTKIGKVLSLG